MEFVFRSGVLMKILRLLLSVLAILGVYRPAMAAVAFGSSGTVFSGGPVTSLTDTSMTVGSLSNGVLVVFLEFNPTVSISGVTVNWDSTGTNQSMTQIGTVAASDATSNVFIFGLIAPTAGNKTLSVSWTGSSYYVGIEASYSGAKQTSIATTFTGVATNATTPTTTGNYPAPSGMAITTTSGEMAILAAASLNGTFDSLAGLGTELATSNSVVSGQDRYLAAAGTTTTVAASENSANNTYSAVGANIVQAAGGGATIHQLPLSGVGQ
jgi:hypothetical protein